MEIHEIKIDGNMSESERMEKVAEAVDRMLGRGGEFSARAKRISDAKMKMLTTGYSTDAVGAMFGFLHDLSAYAAVLSTAMIVCKTCDNRKAGEFAMGMIDYLEYGMNNCHDMMEGANVNRDDLMLQPREMYNKKLAEERAKLRRELTSMGEYAMRNESTGEQVKVSGATVTDAALSALDKLGFSLIVVPR